MRFLIFCASNDALALPFVSWYALRPFPSTSSELAARTVPEFAARLPPVPISVQAHSMLLLSSLLDLLALKPAIKATIVLWQS
jgi:hypothetical protein